jgi:hypothetical protein
MSPQPTQILDAVALVTDLPELGLFAGEVGAIVEQLGKDALEVEFVDASGRTYGWHTLKSVQLVRLHTQGQSLRARLQAA